MRQVPERSPHLGCTLAFVLGGQPGSIQEESFQKWTDQLGITDQPDLLACRRLLFEAHTLMIAHVKEQVSGSSSQSDAGKRLPPLERQSRLDKLRKDIQVPVRGDSEPSHRHDRGQIRLENGALEVFQQNHVKSVDVTDGLRMAACLHRRAAAMAVAGLISYGVAQKWSEKLTSALLRAVPKGFSPMSIPQVLAADKEFWRILAEEVEGDFIPKPDGSLPLDTAFPTVMVRPEVLIHLMPQPGPASRPPADPPLAKWPRVSSYGASGKASPRGVGSPRALGSRSRTRCGCRTNQLSCSERGYPATTPDGDPVCYNYNLAREHVCMKCFGTHPQMQCRK